jgi:NADP-dependent 3-hydroxy acid dehydrogenase YdfG
MYTTEEEIISFGYYCFLSLRFQAFVFFQSICPGMVHTEIMVAGGYELPDGLSIDEFYASMPHLKCQDISDGIIYVLGTPPHVQVWHFNINTFLLFVCA